MTTNLKMSDFEQAADSKSLRTIDGKEFTIVKVVDTEYDGQPSVKITTKETFEIEGEKTNKFHTTREVIVKALKSEILRGKLLDKPLGPVKCVKAEDKKYWLLKDV